MAPMATIVTFLVLMAALSHCYAAQSSSLPDEVTYWKTTLPKTPIPSVIQDLLTSKVQKTFSLKYRQISPTSNNGWGHRGGSYHVFGDPNVAGFLLKKDLREGTTLTMQLGRTIGKTAFLTREAADSVPFSSSDIPKILALYNVADPASPEGIVIQQALQNCEEQGVKGEIRKCATSLESMVEFAAATLGTSDVKVMLTQLQSSGMRKKELLTQPYTIVSPGPQQVLGASGARSTICHPRTFPFALYSCHCTHSLGSSELYRVPLVGKDGTRVMAMATCHLDTKSWSPVLACFKVLKVKPGTPICHFLPEDNLVWVRNG